MAARGGLGEGDAISCRDGGDCGGVSSTTEVKLTSATWKTTESMDSSLDVGEGAGSRLRLPSLLLARRRSSALRCVGMLLVASAIAALVTTVAYNATHIGSRLNWIQKYLKENKNQTIMAFNSSDQVTLPSVPERLVEDVKMRVQRSHLEPLNSQRLDVFQESDGNSNIPNKKYAQPSSSSAIAKSRRRGEPMPSKIHPFILIRNEDYLRRDVKELPPTSGNIHTSGNLPNFWSFHENPEFSSDRFDNSKYSGSIKEKKIMSPNPQRFPEESWSGHFQSKRRAPEKNSNPFLNDFVDGEPSWLRRVQSSPYENVPRIRRDTHQQALLSVDKNKIMENERDLQNIELDTLNAVSDLTEKKNFRRSTHPGQDVYAPVNMHKEKRFPERERHLEEALLDRSRVNEDPLLRKTFTENVHLVNEELSSSRDIYHMGYFAKELEKEAKYGLEDISFPLKLKPLRRTKRVRRKIGPLKPDALNEVDVMPRRKRFQKKPVSSPCEEAELLVRDSTFNALFQRLGECERALIGADAQPLTLQEAVDVQKALEYLRLEVGSLRVRAERAASAATLAQRHTRQTDDNSKAHCSEVLYSIHDKIDRIKFKLTDLTRLLDDIGLTSPPLVVYDMDKREKNPQMVQVSPISSLTPQVSISSQQNQPAQSDIPVQPVLRNEMVHQSQPFHISYIPPFVYGDPQTNYPMSDQIYPQIYSPQQQHFQVSYPQKVALNPYVVQQQPLNQLGQVSLQTQYQPLLMRQERINPVSGYRSAVQGQV